MKILKTGVTESYDDSPVESDKRRDERWCSDDCISTASGSERGPMKKPFEARSLPLAVLTRYQKSGS